MIINDFISKRSKKEKLLGSISLILFLLATGDSIIFQPIKNRIDKVVRNISINEKKIQKNMRILQVKKEVSTKYKKNISLIKMTGSDEEEKAKFLEALEILSRQSYVSLIDVKEPRIRSTSFTRKYIVEAEIEGPIDKINIFIYNIQSAPQLLRIKKFSLTKKGETTSNIINGYFTITKIVVI